MRKNPVSAIVTCKNEERNIAACLDTIRWADEIVVVDSGSTDKTLEIARQYTDVILENPYTGAARQRNFAAEHATHDWIFLIDCDERVTPQLQEEVCALLEQDLEHGCYLIKRRNTFFGKQINHCGWDNEWLNRLYRKSCCRWQEVLVHPEFILDHGTKGSLSQMFEHHPYQNFDMYFDKFGRYTTWAAMELHKKGRHAGFFRLLVNPSWSFFKHYFLQLGMLDGLSGFLVSGLAAFYVFVKYAKLWAIERAERGEPGVEKGCDI